jgi:GTPase SAR1 family protein
LTPTAQATPLAAIPQLAALLQRLGRDDLRERVEAALARASRPATIICVVGQFKEGKSSLVNGLVGAQVCPVDDDLTTSVVTLIRYGETPSAVVRRRVGTEQEAVTVGVDELGDWVSEAGNAGNRKGVERVDVATPSPLLREGLILVDTPGSGGLDAAHAATTMAFLRFADAVIMVSDTASELTAPELEFLVRARQECPNALFVQTKTDLYSSWSRIVGLNRAHLETRGLELPTVAVSSALRTAAFDRRDRSLNDRSRFPELIDVLLREVAAPSKALAAQRSIEDCRGALNLVKAGLEQQLVAILDPASRADLITGLETANARLEYLRGPGARWSTVVSDRFADASGALNHRFRTAIRSHLRVHEETLENLRTGEEWDQLMRDAQRDVAGTIADAFAAVEQARADIRAEVAALLQDDLPAAPGRGGSVTDIETMWSGKSINAKEGKEGVQLGLAGLRGAQTGITMIGMMGRFLPAATASLFMLNPVILGIGAVFGGLQMLEVRKRRIAMRRQNARVQLRQFFDDVQVEVGNEVSNALRDLQRELRDEFTERLTQLHTTYTQTLKQLQADAQRTVDEANQRVSELNATLIEIAAIEAALAEPVAA